ncbi:MAG: hypothetical protein HY901_21165 [Deltaproteobacteria bacterium]|nr:hypothetical protein [Deltaproteobacteria bacterium]
MTNPELEEDLDEQLEAQRAQRKRMMGWMGAALVVVVIALAIAAKSCSGGRKDAGRLQLRNAVAKFEANPVDAELAKAAAAEYDAAGRKDEAEKVRHKHASALAGGDKGREQELRTRLAADPANDTLLGQLIEVYTKRKDLDGARKAYAEFIEKSPTPKRHATFGAWLYRNSFYEQASQELGSAVKGGNDDPYTRGYLGLSFYELGRKKEAQKLIDQAIDDGADMDTLRVHQAMLDEEIGAQPEAPPAPKKRGKKK